MAGKIELPFTGTGKAPRKAWREEPELSVGKNKTGRKMVCDS